MQLYLYNIKEISKNDKILIRDKIKQNDKEIIEILKNKSINIL